MSCLQKKTLRIFLLVILSLGVALALVAAQSQQAQAYTYLKTNTGMIFNRSWIYCNEEGYFEWITADPHGPRPGMWSGQPGEGYANEYVVSAAVALWSDINGQDDLVWYGGSNDTWTRGGSVFGHGTSDFWRNGTGWGSIAAYAYGYGAHVMNHHNGLDVLMHAHTYINSSWHGSQFYGGVDFWPRVKIQYKGNAANANNVPGAQYKYIGNATNISPTQPTRTGYTFEGWSTSRSGPVNIAPDQVVGYADWNLQNYVYAPHEWNNGPAAYWHDPNGGQYSPSGSNTITLYAQWKLVSYRVDYAGNGSRTGSTASSAHTYDVLQPLSANGFKRSYTLRCDARGGSKGMQTLACDWRFAGWSDRPSRPVIYGDKAFVKNLRSTPGAVQLFAQWEPGEATLPDPGVKTGYAFKGWYTDAVGGQLVGPKGRSVSISADTTYYARWAPISYRVDYAGNGSTSGRTLRSAHVYDKAGALTPNGFKRSYALECDARGGSKGMQTLACDWRFAGWSDRPSRPGIYGDKAFVKNLRSTPGAVQLFAQWEPGKATLPDPGVKTGYSFKGWHTAAAGGRLVGWSGAQVSISAKTRYYAQWKPISYRVDYAGNGSRTGSTASSAHTYDAIQPLSANGFKRSYTLRCDARGGSKGVQTLACDWPFKGWAARQFGAAALYGERAAVKNLRSTPGAVQLFAQWEPGKATLPDPGVKEGYSFKGWYTEPTAATLLSQGSPSPTTRTVGYTDPTAGSLLGQAGASVSIGADTACYARWVPKVRVSFVVDGEDRGISPVLLDSGLPWAVPDDISRQAYREGCELSGGAPRVSGWYLDAAGTHPYDASVVLTQDTTLYAFNTCKVDYDLTDASKAYFAEHGQAYSDEALSLAVDSATNLPASSLVRYGERVSVSGPPITPLYIDDMGSRMVSVGGVYALRNPAPGTPSLSGSLQAVKSSTLYIDWVSTSYDGFKGQ